VNIRKSIQQTIANIKLFDEIEKEHISNTIQWIESGEEIFRIQKPDTPPKHLVSYCVPYDVQTKSIFLVHHKSAELWLPTGGHVDKYELPEITARRELKEELNIEADFFQGKSIPVFLTQTETVGKTPGHEDVSLWYVFDVSRDLFISKEHAEFQREFYAGKWFTFEKILSMSIEKCDPHMHRFIRKLKRV